MSIPFSRPPPLRRRRPALLPGASLAQLQLGIILEELTRRLPHMRLADGGDPDIMREFLFRGLKRLPVERD